MKKFGLQCLAAPNDNNGNPRRVWLAYDLQTGSVIDAIDEGYAGTPKSPDAVDMGRVDVAPKTYRDSLKLKTGVYFK